MKILTDSEIWSFEAQSIHTEEYERVYLDALRLVLQHREARILDVGAGIGFPTANLFRDGYHNITALDGDVDSTKYSEKLFTDKGMKISVKHGKWQNLSDTIKDTYDVLLLADNALVYLDGWSGGPVVSGEEEVFERFRIVFREFLKVLEPNGMAVIGLGKHYEQTHQGVPEGGGDKDNKIAPFDLVRDGNPAKMTWYISRDWQKRHQECRAVVEAKDFNGEILRIAYLVTKDELVKIMKEVGFSQVHILVPDNTRDNLIIGIK